MTTNYDRRPVEPLKDAWLLDSTGKVVGVELARASNQKTYLPASATDSDISVATATITTATITTAAITTANTTTENVTTLNATTSNLNGVTTVLDPVGVFANQITVPSTMSAVIDVNAQAVLYGPWTVQGSVTCNGEARVF